jgi:hypothetical protein
MLFLDSYAILEMAIGNPSYRLFTSEPAVTTHWNLLEVYYILARRGEEALARSALQVLAPVSVELPLELIPTVATFRLKRLGATGRRFSYVDAGGYVYAREFGYTYLTGAHEFEGLEGVRFVR